MPAKQAIFPSSQRRGGCAERGEGADGVARSANPIGRSLNEDRRNISAELTTPARLLLRLRPIGLALRATPPLRGGEYLRQQDSNGHDQIKRKQQNETRNDAQLRPHQPRLFSSR